MNVANTVIGQTEPASNACAAKKTYTVMEIAALLQISKSKAYNICGQNLFTIIRVGRAVRISKASFDDWLENQTMQF